MNVFLTDCQRSTHLELAAALLSNDLISKELESKFRITKKLVLEQLYKAMKPHISQM